LIQAVAGDLRNGRGYFRRAIIFLTARTSLDMAGCELPSWANRLRKERTRRLWSQKVMAVRLRDAADERPRGVLPAIDSIQRYVCDYEAGRHAPGDLYAELYCRAFGLTRVALFGDFLSARPTLAASESAPGEYDASSCTRSACARFSRLRLVMPSASASFVRSFGGDPVTRG
jgi:hypothetical protein